MLVVQAERRKILRVISRERFIEKEKSSGTIGDTFYMA